MGNEVSPIFTQLKDVTINVVASVDDPSRDTDTTAPVLTSDNTDETVAEAGKVFKIQYEASDEISGLREVQHIFAMRTGIQYVYMTMTMMVFFSYDISNSQRMAFTN